MNSIEYYNRQKEYWRDNEVNRLKSEYETQQLTISEIADIHRRTPGSISYKLKNIGLITHNTLSRGYLDYKNSDLYKQIIETYNIKDNNKTITESKNNIYTSNISSIDILTFAGKPWTTEEEQQLIKEYTIDKLNLLEICEIHKRNHNGICSRLKRLNLIEEKQKISGYSDYLDSDLYKEFLKNKIAKKNTYTETNINISSNSEIAELKKEIIGLKTDVKEMLRIMNALYDFESQ